MTLVRFTRHPEPPLRVALLASLLRRALQRGRSISVWVRAGAPCVRLPAMASPILLGPESHPEHGGCVRVSRLGLHFRLLGEDCCVPWFAVSRYRTWPVRGESAQAPG